MPSASCACPALGATAVRCERGVDGLKQGGVIEWFGEEGHRARLQRLGAYGLIPVRRYKPTVCLYVTSLVVNSYGYGDGRIGPTRCALIAGARGDRWSRCQRCRTSPSAVRSTHSALAVRSRRGSTADPGGFPRSRTTRRSAS